jgi:hypothetical protein
MLIGSDWELVVNRAGRRGWTFDHEKPGLFAASAT